MLTQLEYSYLKRNKRKFKMSREETLDAFAKAGVPDLELCVDFQLKYGGYWPDDEWTFGIVWPDYREADGSRIKDSSNGTLVKCDIQNVTQIEYCVCENGLFCFGTVPVAESFENFLRFKAYCAAELTPLNWTYIDNQRRNTKKFSEFFERLSAERVESASDQFHTVMRSDDYFELSFAKNTHLYVRPTLLKTSK